MSLINVELKDETLFLFANGKIDSGNAAKAASIILEAQNKPHSKVVFDADHLPYISSAGLRVLLQLKKTEQNFKIINAQPETYEIFETTGFTEIIDIEKGYRHFDIKDCSVIGEGAKGIVYRYNDDTIIKVYKSSDSLDIIKNERELSRRAFILGIPTAISYEIVKVGDLFGSVFELIDAKSLSECIAADPNNIEQYVSIFAELLQEIHKCEAKPGELPDAKVLVSKWLYGAENYLDSESFSKLQSLVNNCPDCQSVLHMDYHSNNVMIQNDEAILIDMDTLSCGHPIFELSNIYTSYVAFDIIDKNHSSDFLGIPSDACKKVWELFLPQYLKIYNITNIDEITDIENKIKLLSYTRVIRHIARRGINNTKECRAIDFCANEIPKLLSNISSLDFLQ